jgi:8-oxo-dGTP pyrophosphatase MutT (NUDIX family)
MSAGDQPRSATVSALKSLRLSGHRKHASRQFVQLPYLRELRKCEQVAAVCYRVRGGEIEFLLVRTRGRGRWTFPKGSAEPGLTHAQAAALEAFEEAGVHGRIEEAAFARYSSRKSRDAETSATKPADTTNAHLCKVLSLAKPKEADRNRTWFSAIEAKQRLREGRKGSRGAEFTRVIDQAVERIEKSQREVAAANAAKQRDPALLPGQSRDLLQKVQFESTVGFYGSVQGSRFVRNIQKLDPIQRRSELAGNPQRKLLAGDVLQFTSPPLISQDSNHGKKSKTPVPRAKSG